LHVSVFVLDKKLLWRAYRKSPTLFQTVPFPTPYAPPISLDWRFTTPAQSSTVSTRYIVSETTDFKFGQYVHRIHLNKSPWKIFKKRERGRIQGLSHFGGLLLFQERIQLRTSHSACTFI